MEEKGGADSTMKPCEVSISRDSESGGQASTTPLDSTPTPTPTSPPPTTTTTTLTPLKLYTGNLSSLESSPDRAVVKVRSNHCRIKIRPFMTKCL